MNDPRDTAKLLIDAGCVQFDASFPFKLSSGLNSPIYIDTRKLLELLVERTQIAYQLVGVGNIDKYNYDVIVGIETGSIPWASIIAHVISKPLAYVRKHPKGHGLGKWIEGTPVTGNRVLLIEDIITTGKSLDSAYMALWDEDAKSITVSSIVNYEIKYQSNEVFDLFSLTTSEIIVDTLRTRFMITRDDWEIFHDWREHTRENT